MISIQTEIDNNLGELAIELASITKTAESHTLCKRKGVGVKIWDTSIQLDRFLRDYHLPAHHRAIYINGPLHDDQGRCLNEVGNCGCIHAEFKAVLETCNNNQFDCALLSSYAPCSNCANLIVTSGRFSAVLFGRPTPHDTRGLEILYSGGLHLKAIPC